MKHITVYTKLLLVIGLTAVFTLTACQTNTPATPTPLAAATSQSSHTPVPTIEVMETAVPTSTPSPTATQTTTPTPFLAVSAPILSSQGQLAYIKNETLFVETAPNSGTFTEITQFVHDGAWSSDGRKLVLFISAIPNESEFSNISVWDADANSLSNFGDMLSNFPPQVTLPSDGTIRNLNFENIRWSPSNSKISLTIWDSLEPGIGGVWIADFDEASFNLEINGYSTAQSWWLDEQTILVDRHCGSPCQGLTAYNNGELLWELPWQTAGQFVLSSNNRFLINTGRVIGREAFASVDEVNLTTGEIKIIWQATEPGYFPLFPTTLSSDDNFIGFHFGGNDLWSDPGDLYIIDRNGRSYGQRPKSVIVDWRPGGGPVIQETVAEGQTQLLYWPLDGSPVQVFAELGSVDFVAGKWSEDGRFCH